MLRFFIGVVPFLLYFVIFFSQSRIYPEVQPSRDIKLPTYIIDTSFPPNNDCFVSLGDNLNLYEAELRTHACMRSNRHWLKVGSVSN